MTPNLLDELEKIVALSEKATPGKWEGGEMPCLRSVETGEIVSKFGDNGSVSSSSLFAIATTYGGAIFGPNGAAREVADANAELIAASVNFLRTHAPALADMAKRMEAAEPDPALLASMATCLHHGFGLLDARQQQSMLHDMRKLWDEVMGRGYYRPENRERYMAYVHPTAIDATQEGEG